MLPGDARVAPRYRITFAEVDDGFEPTNVDLAVEQSEDAPTPLKEAARLWHLYADDLVAATPEGLLSIIRRGRDESPLATVVAAILALRLGQRLPIRPLLDGRALGLDMMVAALELLLDQGWDALAGRGLELLRIVDGSSAQQGLPVTTDGLAFLDRQLHRLEQHAESLPSALVSIVRTLRKRVDDVLPRVRADGLFLTLVGAAQGTAKPRSEH